MERKKVYIDFLDQGVRRVKTDEYFYRLLNRRFDLQLADTPDYLMHSHDADVHRLYTCKKIFWTAENYAPDFRESDYALTCRHLDDPRHLRWPIYVPWSKAEDLVKSRGRRKGWRQRRIGFAVSSPLMQTDRPQPASISFINFRDTNRWILRARP